MPVNTSGVRKAEPLLSLITDKTEYERPASRDDVFESLIQGRADKLRMILQGYKPVNTSNCKILLRMKGSCCVVFLFPF